MSEEIALPTSADPRFSKVLPGLQLQVNSSSLGPFKTCPRKYYYSIVEGWVSQRKSIHLTFGALVHKGIELYSRGKIAEADHEENLLGVVEWALRATWDFKLGRPWQSEDSGKNRLGLVRTLVWYLDHYGEREGLRTLILANGQPALELPFEFPSGFTAASTGEGVSFIGKLDEVAQLGPDLYIKDTKTTAHAVDGTFFRQFTPDNQFSLYVIAGKVAFDLPVKGLIVDGIQIGATFSRFARGVVPRGDAVLDEWIEGSHFWLGQMEQCAASASWPQNDKSCGLYGGCEFREICGAKPSLRPQLLARSFVKRTIDD